MTALGLKPLPRAGVDPNILTAWENFKKIEAVFTGTGPINMADFVLAGTGISITDNGDGTITIDSSGGISGSGAAGRVAYWSGASALASTADFLFTDSSGAGVATEFQVIQPNNSNAASHSIIRIKTAGTSGGDPKIIWDVGNSSTYWHMGLDISDSGKLKIGVTESVGASGSSTFITINGGLSRVGIGTQSPDRSLHLYDNASGVDAHFKIQHAATSGGNMATLELDSQSGDAVVFYRVGNGVLGGQTFWYAGVDTSDGDKYKIGVGNTYPGGGTDTIVVDTAGVVTLPITTDASAVGTAALVLSGGLGVAKKFYLGDDLYLATGKAYRVAGTQVLTDQQTGIGATPSSGTAGGTYGATEQTMLQEAHDMARLLATKLKIHGLVAT